MKGLTCIAASALLSIALPAHAETAKEAAMAYETIGLKRQSCRTKLRTGELRASLGQIPREEAGRDWAKCKIEVEADATAAFEATMRKIKKPKARELLKDYQAKLLAAIRNDTAKDGESEAAFSRRLAVSDEQLDQAWQRLQLEL